LLRVAVALLALTLVLALTLALALGLSALTRPAVSIAPLRVALSGFRWMSGERQCHEQCGACGRKSVESHVSLE